MKYLLLICTFSLLTIKAKAQTAYTWNGSTSTAFNVATNWTPNGVPTSADNITIVTGGNSCILDAARGVNNITLTSGTLNLNGFVLTPTGNAVFTVGTVNNGTLTVNASTSGSATFASAIVFSASAVLNVTTGGITINGGTFGAAVTLNQTGAANPTGSGGATFNSAATFSLTGTGYFRTNGNMTFNGPTVFTNTSTNYMLFELTTGNTYNSSLTLNNLGSGQIRMSYLGTTNYNGNIIINNTGASNVYFGEQAAAVSNLSAGNTISIGAYGFNGGNLLLYRFNQIGSTPQTLTLTGTAIVTFGPSSSFGGNVTTTASGLLFNGCNFAGTLTATKNGASSDAGSGGNTFNGTSVFNNTGSGYLMFGNNSATPDIWNGDVTFNNTGTERILPAWNSAGNQFNGNLIVSNTGTGVGINFCSGGSSSATLAVGKNIQIGAAGFNTGYLILPRFTQAIGGAASNLTFTGAATYITIGPSSNIGGDITIVSPRILLNGCTYGGNVNVTKNGVAGEWSNGGNTFNGTTIINSIGTTGYFGFANGAPDVYNGDVYVNNNSTERIIFANNCTGNKFNGNVIVTEIGASLGIAFGWGTTDITMAAGKTISIGAAGYNTGYLQIARFTQLGNTPVNLTMTGGATSVLSFGPSSAMGGDVTTVSPGLQLNGCNFSGITNCTKNGPSGDYGAGGNTFNGVCSLTNSGSSYLLLGNTNPDTWNSDVTFTNSGSERIIPCWASVGNMFNGNIYINTSGSAQGVAFCAGNATATATLSATKSVFAGSGTGLTVGYLTLKQFTQLGTAPINLTGTGTTNLMFGPNSVFGGPVTATAPDVTAQGATYNGTATFTKTGGTGNHNNGNQNIFNSTCTINQQSSTGYFMLGYNSNDLFNDNITVTSTGTSGIELGWSSGTGTPTLASGKTILVGGAGYASGTLNFGGFTQLGTAPITLALTGTAIMTITKIASGPCTFGGAFDATAPDIWVQGGTFNGTASFTKTGGTSNHNQQTQNIFNSTCTINQQSSTGYFMLGYGSNDLFNDNIIVTSSGTGGINIGWQGSPYGTPTLAAGKTILVGGAGFSSGYLNFNSFTQLGNAPINLTFTGTAASLCFAHSSLIGGNLTSSTPDIFFNGATFSGTVNSTKTGAGNDAGSGGNIFNGASIFTNNGAGYYMLGNGTADVWNADATFTNTGSNYIYPCWTSANNQFNGNIILNSSGSAIGINFCGNTVATATQAAGYGITIGSGGYSSGYLTFQRFTQLGTAAINLPLASTANYIQFGPTSSFNGNITSSSPGLYFNSSIFNGTVNSVKVGTSNDASPGGNTFNAVSSYTNSGSGYLMFGNGVADTWNADVTFTDAGTERILPCWNSVGNQFNGNINVNTSGSAQGIYFCGGSGVATATLAATKTVQAGSSGLNAGYLILKQFTQLGNAPINLTMSSTASYIQYGPLSNLGGNVTSVSPGLLFHGCTFNGTTTCTKNGASNDQSNGSNIFTGTSIMNCTGSGYLMFGNGIGDQFLSTSTFNNTGTSNIYLGYNSTGNVYNGLVTLNNTPTSTSSWIYAAVASTNNSTFNNNIVVNNVNGAGVSFGNSTGTATLTAGNTITVGASGFNAGTLQLKNFTQIGSTPQSLTTTGTSNITYGPVSAFGGNVTSVSPGLYFHGCNFGGTTTCTKNGSSNDQSNGGNIFTGVSVMNCTGSGYLLFGNGALDQFLTTATFNNTGTNGIYLGYNSVGNVYNGVVTLNNTPSSTAGFINVAYASIGNSVFNNNIVVNNVNGAGIYFGQSTGTTTLTTGNTITIGAGGFNSGTLNLRNFTQSGGTAQNLTTTGTSNITYGPGAAFGGNVTSVSPGLYFHGCNFGATTTCTKNGSTSDQSNGGNIFTGTSIINNSGSGYLMFSNGTLDQFLSTATFNNTGTSGIYTAYNSANNVFNGLVTLNNTPSTTAGFINFAPYNTGTQLNNNVIVNQTQGTIYFGNNLTAGNFVTQANGFTINSGTVTGGDMYIYNYKQAGSTLGNVSNINNTNTTSGNLFIYNSTFYDNFTGIYPNIRNVQATTFNGSTILTKTGGNNQETWYGSNFFNGSTTITNQAATAAYYLYIANNAPDAYNSDVSFVQANIANIYPNYNSNCTYGGNITVTSPATNTVTFGNAGGGIATMNNSLAQTISRGNVTTPVPNFTRFVMNKTSNAVTLNTRINITSSLTMTVGTINTTSVNIVNMNNASTTTVGNASSYINGPMNYDMAASGARTLNFPIGKLADWRPAILALNHSAATAYTYNGEVFDAPAPTTWTFPATIDTVSGVHYWVMNRYITGGTVSTPSTGLSGNQIITLYYDVNDKVYDGVNLTIVKNTAAAPTTWIDIGGGGGPAALGGIALAGSVTSTSSPSAFNSFSTFTLASKINVWNPLPVSMLYFTAKPQEENVVLDWATADEINNSRYEVERSKNGSTFEYVTTVNAYGNGNSTKTQTYQTLDTKPFSGTSYYRLKQIDKNGVFIYTNIAQVNFDKKSFVSVYPNPAVNTILVNVSTDYDNTTAKIMDALGREVLSQNISATTVNTINTTTLESGMYYVIINNGAEVNKTKITIQK